MKKIIVFLFLLFALPISVVEANEHVYLGGDSIGIEGEYDGVYVSGTYQFTINEKTIDPAKHILIHDLIVAIDNTTISSLDDFTNKLHQYKESYNDVTISVIRKGKLVKTNLVFKNDSGTITCGLYLKEKVLGIGTMTFYNPKNHIYGALGHPITNDMNDYLQKGNIYAASIDGIDKAEHNKTGDKLGNIEYSKPIGSIHENSEIGIYGTYQIDTSQKTEVEVAKLDEIHLGDAQFLTVIDHQEIEAFNIEITHINKADLKSNKSITFKVNDDRLKAITGGIIHGMSGSPIIQDGKLIGAITHVAADDATIGYALYIENMIEKGK